MWDLYGKNIFFSCVREEKKSERTIEQANRQKMERVRIRLVTSLT